MAVLQAFLYVRKRRQKMAIYDEDRKTIREKMSRWLRCMYGCWRNKTPREEWAAKLCEMKASFGPEQESMYLYAVGQLLVLTSGEEDMDAFTWLLDQGGYRRFCLPSGSVDGILFLPLYDELKAEFPWIGEGPFITEKERYLDEIFKRCGTAYMLDSACWTNLRTRVISGYCFWLPEPYIALIAGNVRMAEYFWKKEGYGRGLYHTDSSFFMNIGGVRDVFAIFNIMSPSYHGLIRLWRDRDEENLDVLTAALLSGSGRMVKWVLKRFPEIPAGDHQACCILWAKRKIRRLIRQYHPELFRRIAAEPGFAKEISLPWLLWKYVREGAGELWMIVWKR